MRVSIINLILTTIICMLIITTVKGSFKRVRVGVSMLLIAILPLVVCFISVSFIILIACILSNDGIGIGAILGVFIFFIQIGIIYIWQLLNTNIFIVSKIEANKTDKRLVILRRIDKGIKVTNFGIGCSMINLLFTILVLYFIYVNKLEVLSVMLLVLVSPLFPPAALVVIPVAVYSITTIGTIICILLIVNYILVINGTLRLIITSKILRKDAVLHILLMLIPAVNIFSSLVLNRKASKILRDEKYKVGVFGVKE